MKTSIDKKFVTIEGAKRVREDLKEFKVRYTDGDLRRAFEDATDFDCYGDIISCDVCGFGTYETGFSVKMFIDGLVDVKKISFYCDINLNVSMEKNLIEYRKYK